MPTRSAARSCHRLLRRPSRSPLAPLLGAAFILASAARGGGGTFKAGPPPGHTGGFGEPTCRACHDDAPLNEPGGAVGIAGLPDAGYTPGRAYTIEIWLRQSEMRRAGFQVAARFADGEAAGTQAGALAPVDGRTAVVRDTTRSVGYLEHTAAGSTIPGGATSEDGVVRWLFRWTAPDSGGGPVAFHVAANAADDDDSPFGDLIYAASARVSRARR